MVVLGRCTAPYGVKGWVKVHPFGDDPLAWCKMPQWWLAAEGGEPEWRPAAVRGCRAHGDGLVVLLEGVDSRQRAEELKGLLVAVPRAALPEPDENEFYWGDLVGLEVSNEAGELLGRVASLICGGAHDVLVVRDEGGHERLLPFVDAVVRDVNRTGGCIRVAWQADW